MDTKFDVPTKQHFHPNSRTHNFFLKSHLSYCSINVCMYAYAFLCVRIFIGMAVWVSNCVCICSWILNICL